jgi:two-component system, OmpR family, sensor kinase
MSRPRSIVTPIVALVVMAVFVATMGQFAVTFSGPPPFPRPVPLDAVAHALKTGEVPEPARPRLEIDADPGPPPRGEPDTRRDAMIAQIMGVPAEQVHGVYEITRGPMRDRVLGDFRVRWDSPAGVRYAHSRPGPLFTRWHWMTLLSVLAMLIVLGFAAWWIARAISRPIRRLAAAATAARPGSRTLIPLEGPREVRDLASAVVAMQDRILEQAEGRTAMLAAIAHDLGTPLTRIAYWVEQLPDAARERAQGDIEEMRRMLADVLRFGRDARMERPERLDLGSLIESLADDLAAGGTPVTVTPGPRLVIQGESTALRRMFTNLVENAVRYGRAAAIEWSAEGGMAEVRVRDEGPGFGPGAEALFAPFVRGEASRNRATGGTGLGLAIVRGIAEAHGGSVTLEDAPGGGGLVRVRLPLV